jgi:hypothetical protein
MTTDFLDLETWIARARRQLRALPKAILASQSAGEHRHAEALTEEAALLERILDSYDRISGRSLAGTPELRGLLDMMHEGIQYCARAALDKRDDEETSLCLAALGDIDIQMHELRAV